MGAQELTELLACPVCHAPLAERTCTGCGASYAVEDGIAILLPPEVSEHAARQASWFDDEVDVEWETTRPFGAPAFYRWLIEQKLARGVSSLPPLRGVRAVVSCGGSGMDAHLLARAGAHVITADISLGAARRARERARRFGLDVLSVVADAEHLPIADRGVELAYVHDGLHHLEHPEAGLRELARVSSRNVSVTEPARAAATAAAVRIGLADESEEAGNVVARLDPGDVTEPLRGAGFEILRAERYAMLYRHEPGRVSRALSAPPLFPLARATIHALNAVIGGAGNKLAVQAARRA